MQEDESAVHARQQEQEDQPVDIFSLSSPQHSPTLHRATLNGIDEEEDIKWALDDPDDDVEGWKMKVIMEEEEEV